MIGRRYLPLVLLLAALLANPFAVRPATGQRSIRPTGINLLPPTYFDPAQAPAFTGQSPLELVRYCARNGIDGLILSVRLSLDGVPVIWPDGIPDGISNTFLPCEELLWQELAFTDTVPFQDGIQPPVPLESAAALADRLGIVIVMRTGDRAPGPTGRNIRDLLPGIQWEGETCGLVTPSIGLHPIPPERWANPFLLWQDLTFMPSPPPTWRIGDPRIILTLCGVQPDTSQPVADRSHRPASLQVFLHSEEGRRRSEAVTAARARR